MFFCFCIRYISNRIGVKYKTMTIVTFQPKTVTHKQRRIFEVRHKHVVVNYKIHIVSNRKQEHEHVGEKCFTNSHQLASPFWFRSDGVLLRFHTLPLLSNQRAVSFLHAFWLVTGKLKRRLMVEGNVYAL